MLEGCANRPETWINAEIARVFTALHEDDHAHSLEIWQDAELVGGVYGVAIGGAFCGESMFSTRRDASKVALAFLIDHLRRAGFTLFDTQFITAHLASLGAQEVSRATYQRALAEALDKPADIHAVPLETDGQAVVQRNTQTS